MDFRLSEEQRAIRTMARDFAANEMAPQAARWDADGIFPIATLRAAAGLGMAGMFVPEDDGGSGLARLDAALVFEELARACPSTAAFLSIHNMVGWMIATYGDAAQKARHLPGMMRLDTVVSYCLTEPGAGSDAASLTTRAVRDGDAYVLNGEKSFISGGSVADLYAVMARTGGAGADGISCILVEKPSPGLGFGKLERKLGWHSQPTAAVVLADCRVPAANRLGAEGEGFRIAMRALDGGRVNIAACSLGGAAACLDLALDHARQRRQFGRPIADFQAIQFKLADMATELEAARLMVWRAAAAIDADDPERSRLCAMAKRLATDLCFGICNAALQIHGGYGYLQDFPIERYVRDLRVHQILEGTNEIMRVIVARRLLQD
ncbi:MAG: acyl-CoA dehydrogenase family protein [Alphaproteobacteria bacterium]